MNPAEIISLKRDRQSLSQTQIEAFVSGFAAGTLPDYQMSALAMAILLNGMSADETAWMTQAMLESGATLKWEPGLPLLDKHSTGGVGDKVSLLLAPLLASCGSRVPMISGRGLGPTGGTLDKLEAIPGFRVDLSLPEMQRVVQQVGCVICGATAELVPADRKLYALRDVTGTVPSIPLITASIMSKKLAEGLDALVLDVKTGSGAFMQTHAQARALADSLVATGARMGLKTSAILTDMDQPLGRLVGNAVEVDEAVLALEGNGPADLMEVTLALGGELLVQSGLSENLDQALVQMSTEIKSGRARETLARMVAAQGGDLEAKRPVAPAHEVVSASPGSVTAIDAGALGRAIIEMGGGRRVKTDPVDPTVGIEVLKKLGDEVQIGEPLARIFYQGAQIDEKRRLVCQAFVVDQVTPSGAPRSPVLERRAAT